MMDVHDRLSVLGSNGNRIRVRVQAVFESVVLGASERLPNGHEATKLVRLLYAAHLGLVFLTLQQTALVQCQKDTGVELVADLLRMYRAVGTQSPNMFVRRLLRFTGLPIASEVLDRADSFFKQFVHPSTDRVHFRWTAPSLFVVPPLGGFVEPTQAA